MSKIDVYLLGKIRFEENNKQINLPYKKMEGILAYLLIEGDSTREELSELFWEGQDINNAKKNLRNTVYNIKKLFGEDFIITKGRSSIDINRKRIGYCDYDKVSQCEDGKCIIDYAEFMQGFSVNNSYSFEKWQDMIRKKLYEKFIAVSTKEINRFIEERNYEEALKIILCQLENNQYDEEPYRIAMKIYQNQKRYNEAIALYQKLTNILEKDFSIRPEPATREIFEQILLIRSNEEQNKNIVDELIGCETQFRKINSMIADVIKYRNSDSVLVTGEAGVGKSLFIEGILQEPLLNNLACTRFKCNSTEVDFSLNAIYFLFKQLDKIFSNENVMSVFLDFFDRNIFNFDDKSTFTNYFFVPFQNTITEKLIELSNVEPIIIIVENVNWIDKDSLEILKKAFYNKSSNLFVIFTCQGNIDLNDHENNSFIFKDYMKRVEIKPWSVENIQTYLEYKKININEKKLAEIYELTKGNQLLVKGIINTIEKDVSLDNISDYRIYEKGLLDINNKERRLLDFISIFNNGVSFDDLVSIYSETSLELVEILANLCNIGLITIVEIGGENKYCFKYSILKKYIYDSTNLGKRKQYHLIIAAYYEKKNSGNLDIKCVLDLSYHFTEAKSNFKSLMYQSMYLSYLTLVVLEVFPDASYIVDPDIFYLDKKRVMKEVSRLDNNINAYLEEGINNDELNIARLHLLLIKCRINITSFAQKNIVYDLDDLIDLSKKIDDKTSLYQAYRLMIFHASNVDDVKLYKRALDNLIELENNRLSPLILRFKGYYEYLNGNYDAAVLNYEDSINKSSCLLPTHADNNNMACHIYLGSVFIATKNYNRALLNLNRANKIYSEKNIKETGSFLIYGYLMITYYYLDDLTKARLYAKKAVEIINNSKIMWKKSLFYSYAYLLSNRRNEELKELTLKHFRKSIPEGERKIILSNLD